MTELTELGIAEARDLLARGELSSKELTQGHIAAVAEAGALNAMVTETPEIALAMAEASDARRRGNEVAALEGIPLAIKDLFCTENILTTAGSHILDGFTPPYESTVTANLWRAGAVMLGKTNMDEFAMGSSNETSYHGPVQNPWRRKGDNRRWCRAALPAARRRRWRDVSPWARRRPIPAARSGSRRPSPAPSAASRPMAVAPAGA